MGFILVPEAISRLEQLGVHCTGSASGIPLERYICRNGQGDILSQQPMPNGSRSLRRCDLITALSRALGASQPVEFNAPLEHLEFGPGGRITAARLTSGAVVHADLFIAADGTHSRARRELFPGWPTRPARVTEIVGIVRCPDTIRWAGRDLNKFHAEEGGLAVGVLPVDRDHVVWFLQFDSESFPPPEEQEGNNRSWLTHAQKLTYGWAQPIRNLLSATDLRNVHLWRPIDADLVPIFYQQNLVLVGDAAHPLSPFTSQGVSSAIADAMALANALESCRKHGNGHLAQALASYSNERYGQCVPYLSKGRELTQKFLAPLSAGSCWLPLAI
jgi:2-polyprenyl-6-methoxyphenol hydroxylase-like FAD-dependent oxidoreductase